MIEEPILTQRPEVHNSHMDEHALRAMLEVETIVQQIKAAENIQAKMAYIPLVENFIKQLEELLKESARSENFLDESSDVVRKGVVAIATVGTGALITRVAPPGQTGISLILGAMIIAYFNFSEILKHRWTGKWRKEEAARTRELYENLSQKLLSAMRPEGL